MPEGDTVHQLARALTPELCGERLIEASVRHEPRPDLRGRRVLRVDSLGKHLYLELDDGRSIRSHLGLYGAWHRYRPGEPWRKPVRQASLVLTLERRVLVCFNAKEIELLATRGLRARDQRHRLGPDLTRERPDPRTLWERARERLPADTIAVDVLLDQRIASGIGNIYKSEVLFLERCEPTTRLAALGQDGIGRLYATAGRLLMANLDGGPRATRDPGDGRGRLWVYRRGGLSCLRCGTRLIRASLGQPPRSTYWCPSCQPPAP